MPQDEWDLRYRAPIEPEPAEEVPPSVGARILRVLTWSILVVCLLVWAVIGAVFWIPLVLRTMLLFSVALVQATMEGSKPTAAARTLRDAVGFYRRGFVIAVETVMGAEEDEEDRRPMPGVKAGRLFKEIGWAALVWYGVAVVAGAGLPGPIELLQSFLALPWGEWVGEIADGLNRAVGRSEGVVLPEGG